MEKKEKIEKPEWVEQVERFPVVIQQQVGNLCASVIASLVQIHFLSVPLYDAVRNEADNLIYEHFAELGRRKKEDKKDD